jgi:membrane-associated protease RseP (regulator of RpoE activity)
MNLLFAIVLFAILLSGIGIQTATTTVSSVSDCVIPSDSARSECEPTDPQAPAAAAGIRSGDVIVAVDDEPISTFAEAAALIQASPERAISITVERDGETLTLPLTPVAVEQPVLDVRGQPVVGEDGEPQTERVGLAGIRQEVDYLREPVWVAPQMAFERVGAVAGIIWQMPVKVWEAGTTLVTGEERDPNGPLSIVGAGRLSGEVAAADAPVLNRVAGFLELLAAVNIALFVFNLIPLLPLDGGHIAVALWEGIKRVWAKVFRRPPPKPVDATKLVPVTFIVVVALIAMGAVLILTDIVNPVSLFG